ncbi:Succinylglutamate desuccinylase / Aspartoacylase family protein [Natronoarchaeum philippinense]|uniref:Succinylglutamate desuccinylase / Aspartoacylase family protein n=1 Tax=Natronoarchaeum philippinense TaxID=558529 RepID=A0A285N303_NATPI|nr:succinylglutamate desuccinylase/aspartoacylase family protein [Natronoarchaeum philippinense]SNZ03844.1 Succinylglutamate desuccinylase / Aspartoacylase family protein [Natronoarchaeum philippinense]
MRVEQLGDGTPELAIVGGIHGDEPSGVSAVERLIEASPPVERPVLLVIANERAIEAGERYLDADLNRVFPGDPDADAHEKRLAHELAERLQGTTALSMHATQSHPEPFMVSDRIDPLVERLGRSLPVESVVDTGEFIQGRLFRAIRTIEIESGLQGSDAAEAAAIRIAIAFLEELGALSGPVAADLRERFGVEPGPASASVPVFRLTRSVPKSGTDDHLVSVNNFELVDAGERFATADGVPVVAEEEFYPVLLSAEGYDEIFGYAAEKITELSSEPPQSAE